MLRHAHFVGQWILILESAFAHVFLKEALFFLA